MNQEQLAIADLDSATRYDLRHGFSVAGCHLLLQPYTYAEVVKRAQVCAIPNTPRWFLGFINHRGEVVPVYDLAGYLGISDAAAAQDSCLLLLDRQPESVALRLPSLPQGVVDPQQVAGDEPLDVPVQLADYCRAQYHYQDKIWLEFDHQAFCLAQKQHINSTDTLNPA